MIATGLVATGVGIAVDRKGNDGGAPASVSSVTSAASTGVSVPPGSGPARSPTVAGEIPVVQRRAVAVAMSAAQDSSRPVAASAIRLGPSPHLAATSDGRLLISDAQSRRVYVVSADDTDVSTLAGDGKDGRSPTAILQAPGPVAVDSFGGIVIADQPVAGKAGRILRIDPSGQSTQMAEITTEADHLYTDDQGAVFVQLRSSDTTTSTTVMRIGAAGDLEVASVDRPAPHLITVAGGRWLSLGQRQATLVTLSLFGSPTDGLADVQLTGLERGSAVRTIVPIANSRFAAVACAADTRCSMTVHDADGSTIASAATQMVSSIVGRAGGFDIATVDGQVLRVDDPLHPDQTRTLLGAGTAPVQDSVLDGPAADAHLDPVALAVAPDGTVYWIDLFPSVSIGALRTDGRIERLALATTISQPGQMVAARDGLVILGDGQLHLLPYDTLRIGQRDNRTEAARSAVRSEADPVVRSVAALAAAPDASWTAVDSAESRRITGGLTISLAASDGSGYIAAVDRNRLMGFDQATGTRTEIARTVNPDGNTSAAAFGLPDTEIGSIGGIVAVGPRQFVITDPASDRLSLVARTPSGSWQISRFLGTQPSVVTGSPLSQRTVRPRHVAAAADGTVVFTAEGGTINRMGTDGTVRVIAGGAAPSSTLFGRIGGVAVTTPDPVKPDERRVLVVDTARHRVVLLNRDGTQTLVAGTGVAGAGPNDLDSPTGIGVGNQLIVIADSANHRVIAIDPAGQRRVIAGTGIAGNGVATGPAAAVALNNPTGVAVAADGRIAIADTDNNRVLLVNADGQVSPLASVDRPTGVAFQGANHLVISASTDGQVYRVELTTRARSVVAGIGVRGYQGDGGRATSARLQDPNGLAIGPDGAIYVADAGNGAIRRISPDGRIDTLTGGGVGRAGWVSGDSFTNPTGVVIDPLLGMIFGEADGRLFSVSTAEMDAAVPGWFRTVG